MTTILHILFRKRISQLKERYAGQRIIAESDANFFGLASAGKAQIRGNGYLLLTATNLVFSMFVPAREVVIPRAAIIEVSTPRSHLGKTVFRPLLKVTYNTDQGTQDNAAWLIPNPKCWQSLLHQDQC